MRTLLRFACVGLAATALLAFTPPGDKKPKKRKYIDPANMDLSVKPGDNFYRYANGAWLKKNAIPASKTRWGSFDELREESSRRLQALLQEAARRPGEPGHQKIGAFYLSGMDTATIERLGFSPIKPDLQRIDALETTADFLAEVANLRTSAIGSPCLDFSFRRIAKR